MNQTYNHEYFVNDEKFEKVVSRIRQRVESSVAKQPSKQNDTHHQSSQWNQYDNNQQDRMSYSKKVRSNCVLFMFISSCWLTNCTQATNGDEVRGILFCYVVWTYTCMMLLTKFICYPQHRRRLEDGKDTTRQEDDDDDNNTTLLLRRRRYDDDTARDDDEDDTAMDRRRLLLL